MHRPPNLPQVIGPSQKLRDTVRLFNERLPVSYEEAKRQVDLIQSLSSPRPPALSERRNPSRF